MIKWWSRFAVFHCNRTHVVTKPNSWHNTVSVAVLSVILKRFFDKRVNWEDQLNGNILTYSMSKRVLIRKILHATAGLINCWDYFHEVVVGGGGWKLYDISSWKTLLSERCKNLFLRSESVFFVSFNGLKDPNSSTPGGAAPPIVQSWTMCAMLGDAGCCCAECVEMWKFPGTCEEN